MASKQSTVDFIVEQMTGAGTVTARKMFGEYGIYCNGKVVALVCDDKLFVKPTAGGKAFAGKLKEAPAYTGAKPSLIIGAEKWDDPEWLSHLIKITAAELPMPTKKPSRKFEARHEVLSSCPLLASHSRAYGPSRYFAPMKNLGDIGAWRTSSKPAGIYGSTAYVRLAVLFILGQSYNVACWRECEVPIGSEIVCRWG
jgi:TfoX/Sxy family transcriptional regulator of competence genes